MMVRIAINLAQNRELGLPMQPLVWALAFGACMGGKKLPKSNQIVESSSNPSTLCTKEILRT